MIRLVLADDQLLVRQGVRNLLSLTGDIQVVGEACDGLDAVDLVLKLRPDVGLFDVRMPGGSGLDALRELRRRGVDVPVILLTTFDDDASLKAAMRLGAAGWLMKDISIEMLASTIRHVAAGGRIVQPLGIGASEHLQFEATRFPSSDAPVALTDRELEVLRLIARGMSSREIGDHLGTMEGTVKNQTSSILSKLGVRDRTRAVLRAAELGLL